MIIATDVSALAVKTGKETAILAQAATPTAPASPSPDITVYITRNGKKYYRNGGSSLSKSRIPRHPQRR